jgi:hypothetical protein
MRTNLTANPLLWEKRKKNKHGFATSVSRYSNLCISSRSFIRYTTLSTPAQDGIIMIRRDQEGSESSSDRLAASIDICKTNDS